MHLFSREHHLLGGYAFIGEGIPVVRAAFTSKYKKEVSGNKNSDAVTAAFFGDGTCNNGQFYECLNMAQLWKLPIIFVVENNKWAMAWLMIGRLATLEYGEKLRLLACMVRRWMAWMF